MVKDRVLPWVKDNDVYNIWENWDISNRDLIFLDKDGNFVLKINLTNSYNGNYIINVVDCLLEGN